MNNAEKFLLARQKMEETKQIEKFPLTFFQTKIKQHLETFYEIESYAIIKDILIIKFQKDEIFYFIEFRKTGNFYCYKEDQTLKAFLSKL